MPLSKHKTIYISSRDRVSGNKNKFSINLAELLWDLEPDSRDPQISRVDVSVDNLWVPFKKGSGNRQTRTPQVFLDSNLEPPPIRLRSTIPPRLSARSDAPITAMDAGLNRLSRYRVLNLTLLGGVWPNGRLKNKPNKTG